MEKTIFIIDDEQYILDTLSELFKFHNFQVKTTVDEETAIEIFNESFKEIDIVILDMTLKKYSGIELGLKLQKINPNAIFLFMSGYDISYELKIAMNKNNMIYDFCQKPFKFQEILEKINKLFERNV